MYKGSGEESPGVKESPGFNIHTFVNKLRNVDGKALGKDGKPLARKNIHPASDLKMGASRFMGGIDKPGDGISGAATFEVKAASGNDPLGSCSAEFSPEKADDSLKFHVNTQPDNVVVPEGSNLVDGFTSKPNDEGNMNTKVNMADMSSSQPENAQKVDGESGSQPDKPSYASVVNEDATKKKVNFRLLESEKPTNALADVQIPMSEVLKANSRFEHTLYGYFLGKRVVFPVVQHYVLNIWKKYGITHVMMNAKGFFFFKFNSATGMDGVLENRPWFICSIPIVLKKWTPNASLLKEDISSVSTWVKLYDVPIAAFTEYGLSVIASKLGIPIMLDSYTCTMCTTSWGRLDFARALIDLKADQKLRDSVVVSIPREDGLEPTLHTLKVEYEWKPPRCDSCKVFGHIDDQCPQKVEEKLKQQGARKGVHEVNKQNDSQDFKHVPVKPFRGLVVGNKKKPAIGTKTVYVPKKNNKEASSVLVSNQFEILNTESKADGAESSNKHVAISGNDRGKEQSLYQKWQGTDGNEDDDDEDDVYDPTDYDIYSFMDSHDRSRRKRKY